MSHKTTVTFSDQAWRTIEDLSASTGHSMSEVLRDALAIYRWSIEARAAGDRILIEKPSGQIRELISL